MYLEIACPGRRDLAEQREQFGAIGWAKPVVHQPHQQGAQGIELVRPIAHGLPFTWRSLRMRSSNSLRTRREPAARFDGRRVTDCRATTPFAIMNHVQYTRVGFFPGG